MYQKRIDIDCVKSSFVKCYNDLCRNGTIFGLRKAGFGNGFNAWVETIKLYKNYLFHT